MLLLNMSLKTSPPTEHCHDVQYMMMMCLLLKATDNNTMFKMSDLVSLMMTCSWLNGMVAV